MLIPFRRLYRNGQEDKVTNSPYKINKEPVSESISNNPQIEKMICETIIEDIIGLNKKLNRFIENDDKVLLEIRNINKNEISKLIEYLNKMLTVYKQNNKQQDIEKISDRKWSNIIAVSAGGDYTVGLKKDGTVVTTATSSVEKCLMNWKDIIAVSAGEYHMVGLKKNGTVVAVDYNKMKGYKIKVNERCDVNNWKKIIAVSARQDHTVGLKKDGTVVATSKCFVWRKEDIIAVSEGGFHTVGLKRDGTVVATGFNTNNQCDVKSWKNIIAVSTGLYYTVGLKKDGTVVATGSNANGQCDVESWKNIIAVSAGESHTVGLKKDGTVVATGSNANGQCDVEM